eukprot:1341640-Amorphochlora_amoeboformis.AAC.2
MALELIPPSEWEDAPASLCVSPEGRLYLELLIPNGSAEKEIHPPTPGNVLLCVSRPREALGSRRSVGDELEILRRIIGGIQRYPGD